MPHLRSCARPRSQCASCRPLPLHSSLLATLGLAMATMPLRADESSAGSPPGEIPAIAVEPAFGAKGSARLNILGGYTDDFDDAQGGRIGVGASWFVIDDLSLDLELWGFGVSQPGPDAAGAEVDVLFRWHFLSRDTWTLFLDAGVGVAIASEEIPSGGTNFNFTPQVGLGATVALTDDLRLVGGVRWHHISNAQLSNDNPGRDELLAYVGVSVPF